VKYLLDTNLVCELVKLNPAPEVVGWITSQEWDCGVSAITVAEMRFGVDRLPAGKRKTELNKLVQFLIQRLTEQIIPFDSTEAYEWGRYGAELENRLGKGWMEQIEIRDTLIAATARAHGMTVVTRNIADFPEVKTLNPFAT
jgi:hypothetical protein